MYKSGLIYPTHLFFILDDSDISSISDIINIQKIAITDWNESLTTEIKSSKGNEVISLLLNYYPNIIFRNRNQIGDLNLSSTYIIDESDFEMYVLKYTICLNALEDALNELAIIAYFDEKLLIKKLYIFFYKIYFCEIFKHINFSSNNKINKGIIDYNKELKLYLDTKSELKRTEYERSGDFGDKIDFCRRFEKGFRTSDLGEFNKRLRDLKNHFKMNAMQTFKKIIKDSVSFKNNHKANTINLQFKPLFKIVYSYIHKKKFDSPYEKSLLKANSAFMRSLKK